MDTRYLIYEEEKEMRIDAYLSEQDLGLSRSYIKKLIDEAEVLVNDKSIKASYKCKSGDKILIHIPDPEVLKVEAEDIPLEIVYEDEDVLIINKPQGMVVHPAPGNQTGTLVNAIMYHCKDNLSSINGVIRPGIVHRIDKDTSGLLVICKNDDAHTCLAEQFAVHSITRVYTAIVYNHFNEEDGTVDQPIDRSKNDRKKMAISPTGRRAVTHYHVVKNLQQNMSLVECRLETGRTHQIRVHMAHIHHPLLGDPVYGPKDCPYHLKGQVLHAGTLGFIHPRTKEYIEFHSELPEYFQKLIDRLS